MISDTLTGPAREDAKEVDAQMKEIESINFQEIDQMIKRSLKESEEEERKELKAKVARIIKDDDD